MKQKINVSHYHANLSHFGLFLSLDKEVAFNVLNSIGGYYLKLVTEGLQISILLHETKG